MTDIDTSREKLADPDTVTVSRETAKAIDWYLADLIEYSLGPDAPYDRDVEELYKLRAALAPPEEPKP